MHLPSLTAGLGLVCTMSFASSSIFHAEPASGAIALPGAAAPGDRPVGLAFATRSEVIAPQLETIDSGVTKVTGRLLALSLSAITLAI